MWRPVARSVQLGQLARRYRNTIWAALFLLAVAVARPPAWGAALDAVVLCGYLVSLDVVTAGAPIRARVGRAAFAVSVAVLAAGTAAIVAVPRFGASWPRVPAAVAAGLVVLLVLVPMRLTHGARPADGPPARRPPPRRSGTGPGRGRATEDVAARGQGAADASAAGRGLHTGRSARMMGASRARAVALAAVRVSIQRGSAP